MSCFLNVQLMFSSFSLFMEILEKFPENNDIVFFEDGSWDAIGSSG